MRIETKSSSGYAYRLSSPDKLRGVGFPTGFTKRNPIEFFFEVTRSRLGRMLPPRTGLLSIATDLVARKEVEDVLISSVAITYDCVIEANMYAHELTGAPKIPESFSSFLSSASVLRRKFGSVHIRFPPLLSVRAIMSNSAALFTEEPSEEEEVDTMAPRAAESGGAGTVMQGLLGPRGVVAEATAAAVVNALVHNTVITSTGLAAAVILSCRSAGDNILAMPVLGTRILQLRRHVTEAGAETTDSRWNGLEIADYAMQFLRPHLELGADGIKPPRDVLSLLVLAQHVGPLIDRCRTESIVCLCIQRSRSNPRAVFSEIAPLLYAIIAPCAVADAVDFEHDFDACVERMLLSGVLLHQHSVGGNCYSIKEDSVVVQVHTSNIFTVCLLCSRLSSGACCACRAHVGKSVHGGECHLLRLHEPSAPRWQRAVCLRSTLRGARPR